MSGSQAALKLGERELSDRVDERPVGTYTVTGTATSGSASGSATTSFVVK